MATLVFTLSSVAVAGKLVLLVILACIVLCSVGLMEMPVFLRPIAPWIVGQRFGKNSGQNRGGNSSSAARPGVGARQRGVTISSAAASDRPPIIITSLEGLLDDDQHDEPVSNVPLRLNRTSSDENQTHRPKSFGVGKSQSVNDFSGLAGPAPSGSLGDSALRSSVSISPSYSKASLLAYHVFSKREPEYLRSIVEFRALKKSLSQRPREEAAEQLLAASRAARALKMPAVMEEIRQAAASLNIAESRLSVGA